MNGTMTTQARGDDMTGDPRSVIAAWQPIETAPRDGTDILVWHKVHQVMTARFCAGEWSEHHEYGRQYDGPVWCIGDDAFQEEIEEGPDGFHDGLITHWMPLLAAPSDLGSPDTTSPQPAAGVVP